jgi:hypothetical protein
MENDDRLRLAVRDFAHSEPSPAEYAAARRTASQASRHRRALHWATAAVVAVLVGGVVAWIAWARPPAVPPTDTTPLPTPTTAPGPSTSSPSPAAINGYPQQTRQSAGLPTGGLGDTVAGLTLTDVTITDANCPDASRCPGAASLTVRNATSQRVSGYIYFNVFRNNTPAVGDAARIELDPGTSTTVTINVQPMLAENAPVGRTGSLYSWNFSVETP